MQNVASRLFTGTNEFDHVGPGLKSLHWFPVQKRIDFNVLLFVYRALRDQASAFMIDMLQERTNV